MTRQINENPLIYFDNAATTQKPRQVIDAIKDFYENHNANVHRAVHSLSQEATELHEKARETTARFINAKDATEIIFVRGTTEAINLVAYSWGLSNLKRGDEILLSIMEHHSNLVPWELLSQKTGCKIIYGKINDDGTLDYKDFEDRFTKNTKIACLSQVSNVTGVVNDVKRIARSAHDNGTLMLVDGAQSVPHMPVDVKDLGVDFLAFSGHKMLGPTGIGVLYSKKEHLENMKPFQGGGEMISKVSYGKNKGQFDITWNDPPWKFEAGTPNIGGGIALMEAIKYLEKIGLHEVFEHERLLTEYALSQMQEFRKVKVYGPRNLSSKCGIIPFTIEGFSSHDIALFFDNYGIMIRSGFHCAQPLHQFLNLQSSARSSFYIYNTREEVNRFIEVLKELDQF